ncbi:MAG: tetratricopeptide repeat protein [Verrucomicrobia bacterium]|nr:tetratricopeptide repeat protein [Verrucomicrobiota bacterium]
MKDIHKNMLLAVVLVVVTFAAYRPAVDGDFIWDDDDHVTDVPAVTSPDGLRDIWLKPGATCQYYPLTFTGFWVQYRLWQDQPFFFHVVNILLHGLNGVLLWLLLRKLKVPGSYIAAGVFVLHPVNVMSVAWICELKNVLAGAFLLGSAWCYVAQEDGRIPSAKVHPPPNLLYAASLGLFIMALLSKSSTAFLPAALGLLLWWRRGEIRPPEIYRLFPFFIFAGGMVLMTLFVERNLVFVEGEQITLMPPERIIVAGRSFWFYLGKLLKPWPLSFFYPSWKINADSTLQFLYPASVAVLLYALWEFRAKITKAPFVALAIFLMSWPAVVLVQVIYMMQYSFVSDHWIYFGTMAVIPLFVGIVATAMQRSPAILKRGIAVVVLLVLAMLTWDRTHVYRDLGTLWRDTLQKNPEAWIAHNNYGLMLLSEGKLDEAAQHIERALELRPDITKHQYNLAKVYEAIGNADKCIELYEEVVRLRPDFVAAYRPLAHAYLIKNNPEAAIDALSRGIEKDPSNAAFHNDIGGIFLKEGRLTAAEWHLRRSLDLHPDNAPAIANLRNLYRFRELSRREGAEPPVQGDPQ